MKPSPRPIFPCFFDLIKDGPPTDIARDKDKLIGEAVWQEYLPKDRSQAEASPSQVSVFVDRSAATSIDAIVMVMA